MQLLKTGQNRFATVSGSMTDVIHHSTQHFSDDDLLAIASYLKSLPAGKDDLPMPDSERPLAAPVDLYSSRAVSATRSSAPTATARTAAASRYVPPLAGNPTVASANPSTLLHITLTGWKTAETATHSRVYTMPGFAQLEDREIAEILSFVRSSWGNQGSSIDAGQVKKLRQQIEAGNDPATTFVSHAWRTCSRRRTPNRWYAACACTWRPASCCRRTSATS